MDRQASFMDDHLMQAHPDLAVRVWNAHLSGASPNHTMKWEMIGRPKHASIMKGPVPDLIASDLRHMTGMRGIWISQGSQDSFLDGDGAPFAFHVLLTPYRVTDKLLRTGLASARDLIRADGRPGFSFGGVLEGAPLYPLMRLVHVRHYPAWEIAADGSAKRYDGRFSNMTLRPTAELMPIAPTRKLRQAPLQEMMQ